MKSYVKPVVLDNDEIFEGVYAASGVIDENPDVVVESTGDCWTLDHKSVQSWDGTYHVFEMHAVHSTALQHISSQTVVTVTFNQNITAARSEFPCEYSGSTVKVTRTLLADAYLSGDDVTYKIWASTGDQATTEALAIVNATITCTHEVNVQGGFD